VLAFALHQIVDSLLLYPKIGDMYWALLGIAIATAPAFEAAPKECEVGKGLLASARAARGLETANNG